MAAVKSKNTAPELVVRSVLHSLGLRFRIHQRDLPGHPDVVLKRHRTVIFVHGCFWHGHGCRRGRPPSTRQDFWIPKLKRNRDRDLEQVTELKKRGWRVLLIWECEVKDQSALRARLAMQFSLDASQ